MNIKQTLLLFTLVIILLNACNKDDVEKGNPVDPDPITPDLTVKVKSSVSGFVVDEAGKPVVYASVTAGDKQALTDEYGYFNISNASLAKIAGQVKVLKTGFFDGYSTFLPIENKESFVRLKLLTKSEVGTVNAATGGKVITPDGGTINLQANGVVLANKNTYSGQVHIKARYINPSANDDIHQDRPGDSRGTDADGHIKTLKSYSTIAVELTDDSGNLLQLKEGSPATITLPIPAALVSEAPENIALWSFDTNTGLWKQEGTAKKNGDTYVGTVTHFSFWEGAEGFALVNFTVHIVDVTSTPLANVPVTINISGMPKNAGYGRFGYTDVNGNLTGAVFANTDLVLDVVTPCALSAYAYEFSTTASDIDLGTITGKLGQNIVTVSGSVTNCDNQPVASGYVQTYDNGFYNRVAISNGSFSFTGLACTNTNVNIVVVDNDTYEQNAPKSVTINPGINNLGTLIACGTNTMGYIKYTFDSTTYVEILEPADTLGGYYLSEGGEANLATQIVTISDNPNTHQKMSFQIKGKASVSGSHKLTDVFSTAFPSGRGYWPADITVTITEYGEVGGFISGYFSSSMLDFEDNSLHWLMCEFKIRRKN